MIVLVAAPYSGVNAAGTPVMVLGFSDSEQALVVDDDGMVAWIPVDGLRIDWRYDWKTGTWYDVDLGDEEDDGTDETADDRGEEVPGELPDADRADGGGEGDGEDRTDWGVVPGAPNDQGSTEGGEP